MYVIKHGASQGSKRGNEEPRASVSAEVKRSCRPGTLISTADPVCSAKLEDIKGNM